MTACPLNPHLPCLDHLCCQRTGSLEFIHAQSRQTHSCSLRTPDCDAKGTHAQTSRSGCWAQKCALFNFSQSNISDCAHQDARSYDDDAFHESRTSGVVSSVVLIMVFSVRPCANNFVKTSCLAVRSILSGTPPTPVEYTPSPQHKISIPFD